MWEVLDVFSGLDVHLLMHHLPFCFNCFQVKFILFFYVWPPRGQVHLVPTALCSVNQWMLPVSDVGNVNHSNRDWCLFHVSSHSPMLEDRPFIGTVSEPSQFVGPIWLWGDQVADVLPLHRSPSDQLIANATDKWPQQTSCRDWVTTLFSNQIWWRSPRGCSNRALDDHSWAGPIRYYFQFRHALILWLSFTSL